MLLVKLMESLPRNARLDNEGRKFADASNEQTDKNSTSDLLFSLLCPLFSSLLCTCTIYSI